MHLEISGLTSGLLCAADFSATVLAGREEISETRFWCEPEVWCLLRFLSRVLGSSCPDSLGLGFAGAVSETCKPVLLTSLCVLKHKSCLAQNASVSSGV